MTISALLMMQPPHLSHRFLRATTPVSRPRAVCASLPGPPVTYRNVVSRLLTVSMLASLLLAAPPASTAGDGSLLETLRSWFTIDEAEANHDTAPG